MISKILSLIKILDKKDRMNLLLLFILTMFAMTLELFSIVAVVPLVQEFLSQKNNFFFNNFKIFQQYDSFNIVFLGFLFIHFIKFVYLFFFFYFQHSFINNLSAKITSRLFSSYLTQDYEIHTQKQTSIMLRNLITETKNLCSAFINPIFVFIIESIILIGIIVFLFTYQSKLSFIIGLVFLLIVFFYILLVKKKFLNWGNLRQALNSKSIKISLDALSGIKDLLIYRKEIFFRKKFSDNEFKYAKVAKLYSTFQQLPRLFFEFIVIFTLIFLIAVLKYNDLNHEKIIEIVSVFGFACARFIPGASKLIGSFQHLRFGLPSLNVILNENILKKEYYDHFFKEKDKTLIKDFESSIEFKNISFSYVANENFHILDKINFQIKKNEFIGILGESGSGKSTFVDLLSGLLKPTTGEILLDGKVIEQNNKLRGLFAYVPQNVYILNDTIKQNIVFDDTEVNLERLNKSIELSHLKKILVNFPCGLDTIVGERGSMLSGGQLQRIAIARAIYNQSKILIFDESTSALDEISEIEIINQIKDLKNNNTIIMISHKLTNLKICDKIFEMKKKKLSQIYI